MLQLKKKRYFQPQSSVKINWANPITKGLALSILPSMGRKDLVTGETWVKFDYDPFISVGNKGVAIDSTAGFGGLTITPKSNVATSEQTHVILVEAQAAAAPDAGLLSIASADGSTSSFSFQDNASTGVWSIYPTSTTLPNNVPFGPSVIIITGDTTSSVAYKDNQVILGSGPAINPLSNSRVVLFGERSFQAGYATKAKIYFHASWTRKLTRAEIQSISENPWQIYTSNDRSLTLGAILPTSTNKLFSLKKKRYSQPNQDLQAINQQVYFVNFADAYYKIRGQRNGGHPASIVVQKFGTSMQPGGGAPNASGFYLTDSTLVAAKQNRTIFWHGYVTQNAQSGNDSLFTRYYDAGGSYDGGVKIQATSTGFAKVTYNIGGTLFTLTGTIPISPGTLKTIFVTFTSNTISLYVDGKLDTSTSATPGTGDNLNLFNLTTVGADAYGFFGHEYQRALAVGALPWAATSDEIAAIGNNPWQLLKSNNLVFLPASITVYRPSSDAAVTSWTGVPGTPLFENINETVYDDNDYVQSPDLSTPEVWGLSPTMPAGSYDVKIRANTNASGQVRIKLLDSGNTVVGTSAWQAVTSSFATYTLSVTTTGTATKVKIEVQ